MKKQEWYGLSRRRKCELLANVRLYLKQIDQLCKPIHLPKDIEKKQEVVIAESEVSVPEAEETDGNVFKCTFMTFVILNVVFLTTTILTFSSFNRMLIKFRTKLIITLVNVF